MHNRNGFLICKHRLEQVWARDGREIFYRNGAGDMVAVRVETTPTFSAGPTSVLFPAGEYVAVYDVTADGERSIMVRPLGDNAQGDMILVQNFFEELRARVPN